MSQIIRVAILEDHQGIVDGYRLRLERIKDIEIAGVAYFGVDLEPLLAQKDVDVVLWDINIPISEQDDNVFPFSSEMPKLLQKYKGLKILVISGHKLRTMINAVLDTGARGYILKSDRAAIENIETAIRAVSGGAIYISGVANKLLKKPTSASILTKAQMRVLYLCWENPEFTADQIAKELGVRPATVRNHLSNIYRRLGVANRSAAILKAQQQGLLPSLNEGLEP